MRNTPQIRSIDWLVRRPIAHRGLHDESAGILENTGSAFAAAMERNYAIECDVQLTADSEAVVFHDETLDRVTESSGFLKTRSLSDLRSVSYKVGSDRIQTLSELLAQVAGSVPLIVEIKSHWDGSAVLAERVVDCVSAYNGPLALMSFDPEILRVLAMQAPNLTRGIVADRVHDPYYEALSVQRRRDLRTFGHLSQTKPHFVSFDYMGLPFAPVQNIRAQGFPVITWTIRSESAASRARRYSDQITFEQYLPE